MESVKVKEHVMDFTYDALSPSKDEFRLLRFDNSDGHRLEGCIRLEIKPFSIADCPEYHALSYVWGSSSKTWPISINGASMKVTQSLGRALERFQSDKTVQWLWADALCINQSDNKEKSDQVQKMRQIYQQAGRVLSWMGLPGPGTERLMENIEKHGMGLLDFG